MTSVQSSDVKKKLITLNLVNGIDFRVSGHVSGNSKGGHPYEKCLLTPESFKLCLIRTQKRND